MVAGHARSLNGKIKNYEFIFKFQHDDKEHASQDIQKKISVIKLTVIK